MKQLKIAFLDTIGLKYTGDTLQRRGLGGSESAVIYLAKELAQLGFDTYVFNNCEKEGVYNNVTYYDYHHAKNVQKTFDILISSRSTLPFAPDHLQKEILEHEQYDIKYTRNLVYSSRYKVIWLHDTFCRGDRYLEDFARFNFFDEIFNKINMFLCQFVR